GPLRRRPERRVGPPSVSPRGAPPRAFVPAGCARQPALPAVPPGQRPVAATGPRRRLVPPSSWPNLRGQPRAWRATRPSGLLALPARLRSAAIARSVYPSPAPALQVPSVDVRGLLASDRAASD